MATEPAAPEEPFVPIPLDEIPYFMLDEFTKVYIDDKMIDDTRKHIEANGVDSYFLFAIQRRKTMDGTTEKIVKHPQIFYISNTLAYSSIAVVPLNELTYEEHIATAHFNLPKIPYDLRMTLDDFFRAADKKFHTEAIVQLTFDPEAHAAGDAKWNGWGFLVPKQENTASHCNYDPTSTAGEKPDHVYLVGSVHSHPGMSAFASGTDHADQDGNDGLHITYGWQDSVNGGETQLHCEMQVGPQNWIFESSTIFEDAPPRVVSGEVEDLLEKVTKKVTTPVSQFGRGPAGFPPRNASAATSSPAAAMKRSSRLEEIKGLPKGDDDPSYADNTIICVLKAADEEMCPACVQPLIGRDLDIRMCTACHSYLALPGEGVDDILKIRKDEGHYHWDIDIESDPIAPIILWERDVEGADNVFTTVWEPVDETATEDDKTEDSADEGDTAPRDEAPVIPLGKA